MTEQTVPETRENTATLEEQLEEIRAKLKKLEEEKDRLHRQEFALAESPFAKESVLKLSLSWQLHRGRIREREFGQRIDETMGTMYDIKNQAFRYAHLLGLDPDSVRMVVTEALQNIIEHGHGDYCYVTFRVNNDCPNPYLVCVFKHYLPEGQLYTMKDVNSNAERGDITSEKFDFEDSRGRGEFMMREIADVRKIINGTEVGPDGKKHHYFQRKLILYRDPAGPRERTNFNEIKQEIDRLDYEDVICYFHIRHQDRALNQVTVAAHKSMKETVVALMKENGLELGEFEEYYRAAFMIFEATEALEAGQLNSLLQKIRQQIYKKS